jgi:hypothetical protein
MMEVTLPSGETIECEVEMDGYKVLDVYDSKGTSLIYDGVAEFGLTQDQVDAIYRQAERDWCDRMADRGDYLSDRMKEEGF